MVLASNNKFPKLILEERLSDGSDTSNPAADHRSLFLGEDGLLHLRDSAGGITDIGAGGSGIPATILDAKGDIIVATAADTAARKAAGANDTILMADSGQTDGLKWVASQTPTTLDYDDAAVEGTADTYARGDHLHGMPSAGGGGGGGATQVGKTTEGASYAALGDTALIAKRLTMPSDGILCPPAMYIRGTATAADMGFVSSFWTDDGGSGSASRPYDPISGIGFYQQLTRALFRNAEIGWFTPVGAQPIWVASGQIVWAFVGGVYQSQYTEIAYDGSGDDLYAAYSTGQVMGSINFNESYDYDFTTTTRNHSVKCPFIPA